jgi:hypothetical protein
MPPPAPAKAPKQNPADRGRIARNNVNTLSPPVLPMPIGHITTLPNSDWTRFRLWVPTDSGGVLSLRIKGSGPPKGGMRGVKLERPATKVIVGFDPVVIYDVKRGEFGEFFVVALGDVGDQITCEFVQISFSRDGSGEKDPPLIPWNFWYWPTSRSEQNRYHAMAADIMAKYGRAFGKDPDACRNAELIDHSTDAISTAPYFDYQGHCHNASPASALFERPPFETKYKNETFKEIELKLLAAEFYGNFGLSAKVWELNQGEEILSDQPRNLLAYLKPGNPKTVRAVIEGLQRDYRPSDRDEVATRTNGWFQKRFNGKENAFAEQVNKWMGNAAAGFYQALIKLMRVDKHPLESNMRGYRGSDTPSAVWNQVFFWYRAYYMQNIPLRDEKDIVIQCELRSNLDSYDASPVPGVSPNHLEVFPDHDYSLGFTHVWRIIFDDAGKIVTSDPRCEWRSIRNKDREDLYAPTSLLILGTPDNNMPTGKMDADRRLRVGNKHVSHDLLKAGLLKLRQRYR